jgi:hypothetical protein
LATRWEHVGLVVLVGVRRPTGESSSGGRQGEVERVGAAEDGGGGRSRGHQMRARGAGRVRGSAPPRPTGERNSSSGGGEVERMGPAGRGWWRRLTSRFGDLGFTTDEEFWRVGLKCWR